MNIENIKSELIEIIETIQTEEVLNRMKSQAQRLREIDKNICKWNCSIEKAELIVKLKVTINETKGGYCAEVPGIPDYMIQGETFDELLANIYEAVETVSADV